MFKLSITKRAEKDISKLERQMKNRVITSLQSLSREPRPAGCLKIQSEEGVWRIRIGDWRIAYIIDQPNQEIIIIRIAHRREFYG